MHVGSVAHCVSPCSTRQKAAHVSPVEQVNSRQSSGLVTSCSAQVFVVDVASEIESISSLHLLQSWSKHSPSSGLNSNSLQLRTSASSEHSCSDILVKKEMASSILVTTTYI